MVTKLKKTAAFTDIHWGAKSNSDQHNQDCLNFIDWFCEQVQGDPTIDHIMFLGDWFENRSAINVATLNWSHRGAKKINDLNLPVYFVIGNHDLYHRHTRELFSTIGFSEFKNFHIVNEPIIVPEIANGVLISPFLFPEEYPSLVKYSNIDTWWGHFEFKGFVVTGYNIVMPTGPDPKDFAGPKHIVSGHFHKRQAQRNVVYMGNTFPTNFGDAGDNNRGMMVYDHTINKMEFINWDQCPKYTKTTVSDLLDNKIKLFPESRIKCIVDVPVTYEEVSALKQGFVDSFSLREFSMEESQSLSDVLSGTETTVEGDGKLDNVDDLVVQMLNEIDNDHIDNNILIEEYRRIRV